MEPAHNFNEKAGAFVIGFYKRKRDEKANVPANVPANRIRIICDLIEANKKMTVSEMAKELNVNEKTIIKGHYQIKAKK